MWLEDQKVRSIYRRSAASSLKMKTVICTLWALALVCVVTEARPSASVSETRLDGSRAQNPLESSEPLERKTETPTFDHYTAGGEIPVQLVYESDNAEHLNNSPVKENRAIVVNNREARSNEGVLEEQKVKKDEKEIEKPFKTENEKVNKEVENEQVESTEVNNVVTDVTARVSTSIEPTQAKSNLYRSRLLNLDVRESDDNSKYGLGIQSRNKITPAADGDSYIYNISPFQGNEYQHINIEDYINKLKNEKLNKKKPVKQEEKVPTKEEEDVDDEEGDVIDAQEQGPIRRTIQHYETIIKPINQFQTVMQTYPQLLGQNFYPGSSLMNSVFSSQPHNYNSAPNVFFLPTDLTRTQSTQRTPSGSRVLDSYFPFVINNPFNEIWSGITNIVEYGPEADVCRKGSKKGRRHEGAPTEIEITSPKNDASNSFPHITKMKVRRGGVAIAGPGGIATAGSGGTAIVGPGGTAYTTRRGTAVVGPGGKVVHVPEFPSFHESKFPFLHKGGEKTEPREFDMDLEGEVVATGPVVYYDDPSFDEF